jgi:hypothetical protein
VRKGIWLLGFFLASSLGASAPDFDPREPISLDLKDAKIAEVVQTLGALANLPVVIDPDVEGRVTIQLHCPYDVALEKLSTATGLLIRIESGRLVASRTLKALPDAPLLPEEFRDAPRILLTDYHREATNPPPLFVRVKLNGAEACYRANFGLGQGKLLDVPLTFADRKETVIVAQVDYDPISRTRYIAVEALGGEIRRLSALGSQSAVSFTSAHGKDSLRVLLANSSGGQSCEDLNPRNSVGASAVSVQMLGSTVAGGKPTKTVFAARLQAKSGSIVKTLSGGEDPDSGQQRGFVVAAYVAVDGKSIAVLFKARAVWTDPKNGEQYYFTQSRTTPETEFLPLTRDGCVAATISPGVATAETVELRVSGEE